MRRLFALMLVAASAGCLPNPQSEWVTQDGSVQRSTLEDPTILAGSTAPDIAIAWQPPPIGIHFGSEHHAPHTRTTRTARR